MNKEDIENGLYNFENKNFKPATHKLTQSVVLDQKSKFLDYKVIIEHFKHMGPISNKQALKIIMDSVTELSKDPNC